ncbi:hypothetical protein NMY22_g12152 [Coprinellus aureogranulatus]|nr:hypothetical protein NMY22_g12152 [Coprinellus aureogranulatus]
MLYIPSPSPQRGKRWTQRAVAQAGYLLVLHAVLALASLDPHLILRDHPAEHCTPYYYAPVNSRLASFPTIWEPAYILHGDTVAEDKWNSIKASVPNISTKGTPMGDFTKLDYPESDDDCWWTYSKCVNPNLDGLPSDVTSIPEPHTLAYGFDDGPNCSHNAFYDYLVAQNQKATMFYIGSNVMDWPLEAQRAAKMVMKYVYLVAQIHDRPRKQRSIRGTLLHCKRFLFHFSISYSWVQMQAIRLVANVTPTCWRPPFGDVDNRVRAIAHGLGLRTILWKYDTNDWRMEPGASGITPEAVDANYENILSEAAKGTFDTVRHSFVRWEKKGIDERSEQAGAIILAHELNNFTMAEAMKYYEKLRATFKNLVPLAVALNKTHPYVEDTGSLGDFDSYTGVDDDGDDSTDDSDGDGSPGQDGSSDGSQSGNGTKSDSDAVSSVGGKASSALRVVDTSWWYGVLGFPAASSNTLWLWILAKPHSSSTRIFACLPSTPASSSRYLFLLMEKLATRNVFVCGPVEGGLLKAEPAIDTEKVLAVEMGVNCSWFVADRVATKLASKR